MERPPRTRGLNNNNSLETIIFNSNNNNNNHLTLGTLHFLLRRCASAARSLHPTTGELHHALSQVPATTLPQLSRPMSSRYHICMEHRLRRKFNGQRTRDSSISGSTVSNNVWSVIYFHERCKYTFSLSRSSLSSPVSGHLASLLKPFFLSRSIIFSTIHSLRLHNCPVSKPP